MPIEIRLFFFVRFYAQICMEIMQKVNVPKAIVVSICRFGHLVCFITFGVTNEFFSSDYYM